jgi:hypothetical protein
MQTTQVTSGQPATERKTWYVMKNGSPRLLDFQLKRENALYHQTRGEDTFSVEYFIPFCFLPRTSEKNNEKHTAEVEKANNLRQDLHDFAFIHATEQEISDLQSRPWNQDLRHHLHHYRDVHGTPITLSDADMNRLIRLFSEKRIKFTIGLPVMNLGPDIEVEVIKEGSFKGQTARIIEVSPTADGICLQLGIKLFNGMKELKISDVSPDDIQRKGGSDELIGDRFLRETEATLLDIISRRIHHKDTDQSRSDDAAALNHLFLYSYITISDPSLSAHFLSLMLICAVLRFDTDSVHVFSHRVQTLLEQADAFPPQILAYLYFAQYIATRDARHRTAAKQLVQQHPDSSPRSLRRLMSLVGKMHSR